MTLDPPSVRRKAIITGAARLDGIGWATALALVQDGFEVVVTGATAGEVQEAPNHPAITARQLDVRDDEAVGGFFQEFARLDALITCAGAADGQGEFTSEGFERVIDINLVGTMRCCIHARAALERTNGAIVTIGSLYSIFGSGVVPAYSASKAGVVQLTKSLAVAWGPKIRVNAVLPGWIRTAMGKTSIEGDASGPAILSRTPAGRFGEPADVAEPIRFLCSSASRFMTGAVFPVDGGYHCSG